MKDMRETPTRKIKSGHYVATVDRHPSNGYGYSKGAHANRGYSTDGEESHRAHSEAAYSEYTLTNERPYSRQKLDPHLNDGPRPLSSPPKRTPPRAPSALSYTREDYGNDSDIYISSPVYKAPSEISRISRNSRNGRVGAPRSVYSVASSNKLGKGDNKRGAKVELMSAPNPFCPNIRGVCCLMLLLNLGLILITLGFVIVIQFYEPLFVWILGIVFLVFGFGTLIGCMVYCVTVCRDAKTPSQLRDEDLYWTKHWQKNIGYVPNEISYKTDKFDEPDKFSDKYTTNSLQKNGKLASSRENSTARY